MRKICSKLHLWLAIPFGLFITLVCLTGALLVFEDEISHAAHPELYYVSEVGTAPMSPKKLAAEVAATLPEDVTVTGVTVSDDPLKTWMVALSKPHRAFVAVDPYTGEVLGRVERLPFFNTVVQLHRFLMNAPAERGQLTVGKVLVGISVLLLVIILITGIVLWCPRQIGAWRSRLAISGKGGSRKFWTQLHHAGGMYAVIFILLMALTGLTWSFGWYRSAFYALFDHGTQTEAVAVHSHGAEHPHGAGNPHRQGGGNPHYQGGEACGAEHYAHKAGALDLSSLPISHDTDRPTNTQGWVYWIHTGKWGGMITKILYFVACLIGASLPLTGYYLWWVRRQKKH